ncbi:MAG: DUF3833 domain-containing protein [Betaproteobacteria bacterium]|jgi:Protein of unknown function (DUF3833)
MTRNLFALIGALLLAGCTSIGPEAYIAEKPALDLFRYFSGTVDGWGVFTDRSNKVVKRFVVEVRGTVTGETLTLDEDFRYSDGTTSQRTWTIVRAPGGRFSGTAPDVIGTALGETGGNALRWTYVLSLDVDGRTYHVDFDDWMYLQDESVMLNRSTMSKFGIRLGDLTLSFRKRS